MLLDASERLFTASATMDTEPARTPTAAFAAQSTMLHAMQTVLAKNPMRVRYAVEAGSMPFANILSNKSVMFVAFYSSSQTTSRLTPKNGALWLT